MKRKVLVIGIGAGNPEFVTVQAVNALNQVSVFFIPNKGSEKQDLARLRREICDRFIAKPNYRMVDFEVPTRDKSHPSYLEGVKAWHDDVEQRYRRLLTRNSPRASGAPSSSGATLALYDSVLRILEAIRVKDGV